MSAYGSPSHHYPSDHQELTHSGAQRKRVGKACDRCRIKKSKCNGDNPCDRCNTDDQVCTYTERKRPRDKLPPRGYVDTLESRCQVLTQGLIELDRLRKNLPVSSTQFVAGRPSGKRANQILKELGIDTTRIDSDIDDYDAFSNGSPGAESLGGGFDIPPYEEGYPRDPREPAYSHSRHRSPGSSCSTSVDASSHHSWGQPEPHTYAVPHGQLLQEQTSLSPTNLTPNREFVETLILDPGRILSGRESEYPAASSPPPAAPAFEYRPSFNHSSHDLSSGYQFYGMDAYQSGPIVPAGGMEHHQNQYYDVQGYA